MPEGIFLTREEGEPVLINNAMKQYMADILGKNVSSGRLLSEEIGKRG